MNSPYDKVLLITSSHVGNNILCTPAIRLLKNHWQTTQLDVLTESSRAASAFVGNPYVHKIFVSRWKSRIRRYAAQYPLVIGLHRDKALEYLTGFTDSQLIIIPADTTNNKHRADHGLDFIQSLVGSSWNEHDRKYVLCPTAQDVIKIKNRLQAKPADIFVGLHLGSGRTAVHGWKFWYARRDKDPKLWSLENYIALGNLLTAANSSIRLVITGLRNEKFLGKKFVKQVPNTINLIGDTSLLELTALMNQINIFVTQDTSALHVACATEVPLVALFGPTNFNATGPYPARTQHTIIRKASMQKISPREVYEAILINLSNNFSSHVRI
jgi:ADP-heptose:LPS heptosyltransferase